MRTYSNIAARLLMASCAASPALVAPNGAPGCALSRMTSEQRDLLGKQTVASATDDKYNFPGAPIVQMSDAPMLQICAK